MAASVISWQPSRLKCCSSGEDQTETETETDRDRDREDREDREHTPRPCESQQRRQDAQRDEQSLQCLVGWLSWRTRAAVGNALNSVVCRVVAVAHIKRHQIWTMVCDAVQIHVRDVTGSDKHLEVLASLQQVFE